MTVRCYEGLRLSVYECPFSRTVRWYCAQARYTSPEVYPPTLTDTGGIWGYDHRFVGVHTTLWVNEQVGPHIFLSIQLNR